MTTMHRVEVRTRAGTADPVSERAETAARASGVAPNDVRVEAAQVYLIEGPLDDVALRRVADELLADPVTQQATIGADPPRADVLIEVHPKPGVMDPQAEVIELAVRSMLDCPVEVRTGTRYDIHGVDEPGATRLAERCWANGVIQAIHVEPYHPRAFPEGLPHTGGDATVPIRDLDDDDLDALSRRGHLFLSREEMRAIRSAYRTAGEDPREIELETLAQTWSEHCVHKTLKATVRYEGDLPAGSRPGFEAHDDGTVTIHNLLKCTVAAATERLIAEGIDWCLSVFVDNAGIIAFDDDHAVCFKCETHNHPSAIEPYGGAATGIGGCIRDILGTGLGARPIAATDVFCVADPERFAAAGMTEPGRRALPDGCLHPQRILREVVAGVRDYGNRMGIPTLNGAVWFHDDYVGNPLVYCGCIGVMPRNRIAGEPRPGDHIVAIGGRTGRDGIHGATFSSAELTDTHADEFAHAVQIGNPITEKKVLDAIMDARDAEPCLFNAITDCGAGGFSSAVGEMGERLGAEVHLDRAPLKYAGLSPTEIWISEAQERMVLAVPQEHLEALAAICAGHDVEMAVLGTFGTPGRRLRLHHDGRLVGDLSMALLHDGLPETVREARWTPAEPDAEPRPPVPSIRATLEALLDHPNIASKRWIIRQYDHEVQGRSVVLPLVGPAGEGPSDAAVIRPVRSSTRGLAIANGLATGWHADPYRMALAAIDECVRNLVCGGADPQRIAILDNFCWPGCTDPQRLGELVRACVGCYDAAVAYRTPFISGKDSLNNQFATEDGRTIRIPPTLLISGFGIVPDAERCVTMDAKAAGNVLLLVGETGEALGGSHLAMLFGVANDELPCVDLEAGPRRAAAVSRALAGGHVRAAHDVSDGGLLVAAFEMAMAGDLGLALDLPLGEDDGLAALFAETPSRYLLEVPEADLDAVRRSLDGEPMQVVGRFTADSSLVVANTDVDVPIAVLRDRWLTAREL